MTGLPALLEQQLYGELSRQFTATKRRRADFFARADWTSVRICDRVLDATRKEMFRYRCRIACLVCRQRVAGVRP